MKNAISMKIFEEVLRNANLPVLMTGVGTHDAARNLSATLVSAGAPDELITDVIEAALPDDYAGDTLSELRGMIEGARNKGFGDRPRTPGRGSEGASRRSVTKSALEMLKGKVDLFHDETRSYMSVPTDAGGRITLPLASPSAQKHIRKLCYRELRGMTVAGQDLKDILDNLASYAEFDGPKREVFRRFARPSDQAIYLDLGAEDGAVVEITPDGWSVMPDSPVAFIRDDRALSMPRPTPGGDVSELRDMLGLDEEQWILLLGFLLNCFRARGPYFCLIVEGPPDSGKTTLCRLVKRLIDPRKSQGTKLPSSDHDLMLIASKNFLLDFDNISGMKRDTSDTLCRIATGAAFETRTLYSDEGTTVICATAPVIINGSEAFARRADLLDRAIPLQLPALSFLIEDDELHARFERARGHLLGALCDAAVEALRCFPSVSATQGIRMIDAVRWITAAEPALGIKRGTFAQVLARRRSTVAADRLTGDPLFLALKDLTAGQPFFGTPTELHDALASTPHRNMMPKNASALTRRLSDLQPQLAHAGIHFEEGPRTATHRSVIIRRTNQPDPQQIRSNPLKQMSRTRGGE